MQVADAPHKWLYEPDEDPKRKHHWNQDKAGFVTVGAIFVGKCPNNMSMQLAQKLLNTGIEWSPKKWANPYPQRILRMGWRAIPSNANNSGPLVPRVPRTPVEIPSRK